MNIETLQKIIDNFKELYSKLNLPSNLPLEKQIEECKLIEDQKNLIFMNLDCLKKLLDFYIENNK